MALSIDACQVVTAAEASALAGVSYGPGQSSTTAGGGKMCVYGSQTKAVLQVLIGQGSSGADAQQQWDQAQAQAQAELDKLGPGLKLTTATVPGLGDRAATASGNFSQFGVGLSAVYVLKGAVFFTMSDLAVGGPVASTDALVAQARTALTRLP